MTIARKFNPSLPPPVGYGHFNLNEEMQMSEKQKELPGIPAGFKPLETGGFAPNWDYKKNPILTGKVTSIAKIPTPRNNKKVTLKMDVATDAGTMSVWESKALEGLFETAKVGSTVWVRYDGEIKVKGRKKSMHGFTAAVK